DLLLLRSQPLRGALEGVVNRLRRTEELVGALDDPPLGVESGVPHQRNERVKDLGHAAAEGRHRKVQDTLAFDLSREPANLIHRVARRDRPVVEQGLVADVDELEHRTERDGLDESAENSRYSLRNFTKRSRDPPDSGEPISTSSATARMIAIPSPPSLRSPFPPGVLSSRWNPAPSSVTSTTSRSGSIW